MGDVELIIDKIKGLGLLEKNWDGDGAYEITQTIIDRAILFIKSMPKDLERVNISVSPLAHGTVEFNIESEIERGCFISVEIGKTTANWYSSSDGMYGKSEETVAIDDLANEVVKEIYRIRNL